VDDISRSIKNTLYRTLRKTGIFRAPPGHVWNELSQNEELRFPNICIGSIIAKDEFNSPVSSGTAWRWDGGLVVTAAHVLASAHKNNVECKFPDGSEAIFNGSDDLHPKYFDEFGGERKGSVYDIAILRVPSADKDKEALSVETLDFSTTAKLIGYLFKNPLAMVLHENTVWDVVEHFGHAIPSLPGHSGGPIIQNDQVVGIHVGDIGLLRKIYPNQSYRAEAYDNTGIKISTIQKSFLLDKANEIYGATSPIS